MYRTMTERQYLERRYSLMSRMLNAKENRCYRTAAARQREIEKLDMEYNNQIKDEQCT